MNNVTPFRGQKVPAAFAHLDPNRALGEGISGGFPILNYRGKVWNLRHQGQNYDFKRDDDGTALTYLDMIIVGDSDVLSKVYYPKWEGEDSNEGPLCASIRGDVPDPGVPQPQSPSCGVCKHNVWTTLPSGNRGKVCQDHKRLAILLMPATTKKLLGAPLLEPIYLKIPPGSLNSLKAYGEMLRHEGYPFPAVITRVSFSPDKLFQMVFEGRQVLTDTEAPLVLPLVKDPRTLRIIGAIPQIREALPKPVIPEEPTMIETGLSEAFAPPAPEPVNESIAKIVAKAVTNGSGAEPEVIAPAPKRRGRPPKNPAAAATAAPAPTPAPAPTGPAFDEEDTELDREVAGLLDMKIDNMLK